MQWPIARGIHLAVVLMLGAACGARADLGSGDAAPAPCVTDGGDLDAGAHETAPGDDGSPFPVDGPLADGTADGAAGALDANGGGPEGDATGSGDGGSTDGPAQGDAPESDATETADAPTVCPDPPQADRVVQVAVGGGRGCGILAGGALKCWGLLGTDLGLGSTTGRGVAPGQMGANLPAVDLGTGAVAVEVRMGFVHTCVRLADGRVKCFGDNTWGQLGLGDTTTRGTSLGQMGDSLPAVDLGTGRTAVAIAAGYAYSCAILDDGTVKCWGANDSGALGQGDTVDRGGMPGQMGDALPPVDLGTGRTAVALAAGSGSGADYEHTCAVLDDGSVKCWGSNVAGELGQGDEQPRGGEPGQMGDALPPIALGAGRTAVQVSAGYTFTCAVLDDRSVKCWGDGEYLGLGRIDSRGDRPDTMGDALPALDLGTGATAIEVAAGYTSACAALGDGRIKCWGDNYLGELGLGDMNARGTAPRQMGDALPAVDLGVCTQSLAVAQGDSYSGAPSVCALLANQTVKCWGAGGELGLGDDVERGELPGDMGDALPTVKLFSDVW